MASNGMQRIPSRWGASQNVTIGTLAQSSVFGAQTFKVRLSAIGGNCHVLIGKGTQTATASSPLVKSTDPPVEVAVRPGEQAGVIQDATSTGTLNIVELTN